MYLSIDNLNLTYFRLECCEFKLHLRMYEEKLYIYLLNIYPLPINKMVILTCNYTHGSIIKVFCFFGKGRKFSPPSFYLLY